MGLLTVPSAHPSLAQWTAFDFALRGSLLFLFPLVFTPVPFEVFVGVFCFYRLLYNAGIGSLLYLQSHRQTLTKHFAAHRAVFAGMEKGPDAFNAWLTFRRFVDVILSNDLVFYIMMCFKLYQKIDYWPVTRHAVGLVLCLVALWGKAESYRVVGAYAWYWGDFFFLVDQQLTFDRVFALAPHPMYTVGYLFFYGASLFTGSYVVFCVSLFGHVCQLLFLEAVENPHIEKTYNSLVDAEADGSGDEAESRRDSMIMLKNASAFRAADVLTVLCAALYVALFVMAADRERVSVGGVLATRVLHSFLVGGVLFLQSKKKFWVRASLAAGVGTKKDAFRNWKELYNASLTLTYVAFLCCFYHYWVPSAVGVAQAGVGFVLVALNAWSSWSIYNVLGEFGFFYGDFFIESTDAALTYQGIYRYVNNPESVLGFAGFYGLSLVAASWELFWLSVLSHSCHWLFIRLVETPHMLKKYGVVRVVAGSEKAMIDILAGSKKQ